MKSIIVLSARVSTLLNLLFAVTSHTRPASTPFNDNSPHIRSYESLLQPKIHSSLSTAPGHTSALSGTTIHRRMMPGYTRMNQMNLASYIKLTSMVPVTAAVKFLEDFFSSIALRANPAGGAWSRLPERCALKIVEGRFQLDFVCIGDTIPWKFVKETADRLWEAAVLGFAELFEACYIDNTEKIGVKVTLSLVENALNPGSASGSTPDVYPDWREGSVPSIDSPYHGP